jgi:cyclohexa-1,5-dienecarbonyl-CoA hydratase
VINVPVHVSFNANQTRAAFRFQHPKGNILTCEMLDAIRAGLESISQNPHLKLITIEGAGSDFSFGASVFEHVPQEIERAIRTLDGLVVDLLEAPALTAAVVRGRCLGGGFELALACDLIFAAEDSLFGVPEIKLGVFPPAASVLLPARVGLSRAMPAIVTGEPESAEAWRRTGLLSLLAPAAVLGTEVDRWFEQYLAPKSAAALRHATAAARSTTLDTVRTSLPTVERLYLDELMQTHDAVEGVDAFLEKRPPHWHDR